MILRDPADGVDRLLRGLGLEPTGGLWSDAAYTVGVARSPGGLFIGWLDVGWITAEDSFPEMRDVAHIVERVPLEVLGRHLAFAIDEARRVRADRLRDCDQCGERFLPGQMLGATCHCCAVRGGQLRT